MKDLRSSRHLIKIWRRREKSTIDHLVHNVAPAAPAREAPVRTHSAFTASGLAIEDQVRKAWCPGLGGLAMF